MMIFKRAMLVALLAIFATGCGEKVHNQIAVESLRNPAVPQILSERFEDACYSTDGRGQWDIVMHSRRPAGRDPREHIEQIVHMSLFWKPVPGTTYAESSQTDALITYALLSSPTAISYEGAGFVFLSREKNGTLKGRIESSSLMPLRRVADPADPLGQCRLTGQFLARLDRSRTVERITDLSQRLGPRPVIQVPGEEKPR